MRKKFTPVYVLAIIVAFILFSSCAKDFMHGSDNRSEQADIGEAKTIFEANATDLREVDFGLSMGRPSTKSNNKAVITPKWEKPFVVSTGKFTIFEVPLGGDVKKHAFTTYLKEGIQKNPEVKKVTTKLILKRDNETGDYIYFIATMVGKNEDKNGKEINYTNNCSFTGYIFISNLEGLCVGIYNCNSGVRRRAEFAKSKTKAAVSDGTIEGAIVQMFENPAEAYSYGESGGGDGGGGGIVMSRCSTCGYPKTNDLCLYCNPIITTPDFCRKCNGPYNNCHCCSVCGDYPCTCYKPSYNCSYCGSYYCNGECRNTCYYCGSKYCSGNCQYTGGGSGGSGGGGGTTNPPTEPDESCSDAKCSTCGKCLNPTKPNCQGCICCDHIICGGCSKLIPYEKSPLTRSSSYNCNTNHIWCGCPWWTKDHDTIARLALKGKLTESQFVEVQKGQEAIDTMQTVKDSPLHAMRTLNQTKEQAMGIMKEHFCKKAADFIRNNNYRSLGEAIHPIQDAYSPAHDFNVWTGSNLLPHLFENMLSYPQLVNKAVRATERIYDELKALGKSATGEQIEVVFNAWKKSFENNEDY